MCTRTIRCVLHKQNLSCISAPAEPSSLSNVPLSTRDERAVCVRHVIAVGPAIVAVIRQVGGAVSLPFRWVRVSGAPGPLWTRKLCVFLTGSLLLVEAAALPHGPRVAVNGILFSVVLVIAMLVSFLFELAVAPLLPVVIPGASAAAGLRGPQLVLPGGLLQIRGAVVLLGVVAAVKSLRVP